MMSLYKICFSPTGGTEKAARILAGALPGEIEAVDLTDGETAFADIALSAGDLAVIAVPSYGGRVPQPAIERLSAIRGNGAGAILLCVYGNRAYEDTLLELRDTATQSGFRVIAAVAAIAEHSIARQFATGRPDDRDAAQLRAFAGKIQAKLDAGDLAEPEIPGDRPYKKGSGTEMVPKPTGSCTECGLCAGACPVQAIDHANPAKVDAKACISCMRCVLVCPHGAREVNGIILAAADAMLKKACYERKEPELHL